MLPCNRLQHVSLFVFRLLKGKAVGSISFQQTVQRSDLNLKQTQLQGLSRDRASKNIPASPRVLKHARDQGVLRVAQRRALPSSLLLWAPALLGAA